MKQTILLVATAVALFTFSSCRKISGEGPLQTEQRMIADFSGISASIGGTINYKIDPVYKVEIIAQRNILDVLQTSRVNGHLLIKVKDGVRLRNHEDITVNVSAPSADYLHLSGSGNLQVTGDLISNNLDMGISGSGNIFTNKITVANKTEVNISGSGNITVKEGTSHDESLRISGSGGIRMDGVTAVNTNATISGSGNMHVNTSQMLDATISGSGSIFYLGTPQVNLHVSGSGKVIKL